MSMFFVCRHRFTISTNSGVDALIDSINLVITSSLTTTDIIRFLKVAQGLKSWTYLHVTYYLIIIPSSSYYPVWVIILSTYSSNESMGWEHTAGLYYRCRTDCLSITYYIITDIYSLGLQQHMNMVVYLPLPGLKSNLYENHGLWINTYTWGESNLERDNTMQVFYHWAMEAHTICYEN